MSCSGLVSCPSPCSMPCPKPCSETCPKSCTMTCSISYPKPCSDPCSKPCSTMCPKPCSFSSFSVPKPCPMSYSKPCSTTCSKACSITCLKTCSMSSRSIVSLCRCGTPCARKAITVYGGGFGGSTRISSCSSRRSVCSSGGYDGMCCGGYSSCFGGCNDYLKQNEKATMQNLNDRLATFLKKVRSLEASNCHLEKLIREYYEKKGPVGQRDFSCYWSTIKCLQEEIRNVTIYNASILLQIDNSRLATDDFRMKYEHELMMRKSVEADIANLLCQLEKTTHAKSDLEMQVCSLQDELACLKKNHQEDVAALMSQLSGTVCVEVNAAPQQDLTKALEDIRCHYEAIIEKHCKEQECWFRQKMAELCRNVAVNTECIETSRSQVTDMRRTVQCLEIDLQSQLSMKSALECSLAETESRYSNMLACFQNQINALEAELCQVRAGIEQQGRDYATLLNIKSCLEQEIATYKCLLENQDNKTQVAGGSPWMCSTPLRCKQQC